MHICTRAQREKNTHDMRTCTYTCARVHRCIHTFTHMHICTERVVFCWCSFRIGAPQYWCSFGNHYTRRAFMHTHTYSRTDAPKYVHHAHARARHTRTCAHTHMRTYIHIHIHTCTCAETAQPKDYTSRALPPRAHVSSRVVALCTHCKRCSG